ncbi:MAG: FAD-binding oxidoreductase, partial [Acidimicrobiales bacterium]
AHDESLATTPVHPMAAVFPSCTAQVASIVALAARAGVPVTARGSGSGLSGGCVPTPGGIVVCLSRMRAVLELDADNQAAIVEPGVTLDELDAVLAPHGLVYPVRPGEQSASIGGTVATNAGGMRAVRYGVTRNNVLGLELVLGTGEVVRSGGRYVKCSSGYDLTQIVIGSEGTLALVTEATLKLQPALACQATVLAPFAGLGDVSRAIPQILQSGLLPSVLEYIDGLTMQVISASAPLGLAISEDLRAAAAAYLLVVIEHRVETRVDEDLELLSEVLGRAGALEMFVLPRADAESLVAARERAFYGAKAAGADDIVDVVVPRANMAAFLEEVAELASGHGAFAAGCGHVGDGNVHLAVFQPDPLARGAFLEDVFRAGIDLGGAMSGEHGIGGAKRDSFNRLQAPEHLALMRRLKAAFDPAGILNPDKVLAPERDRPGGLDATTRAGM